MEVDSFKYLPRLIASFYRTTERQPELPIPWTPLRSQLSKCRFGLVSSAGLYQIGAEPPFDIEREKLEPTWGDPTFRTIPMEIEQREVGVSHLHIDDQDVKNDVNIVLPVHRFRELAASGRIGATASQAYSLMGYQGFPPDTTQWEERYAPEIAERFLAEGVDCVLLTPA